MQEQIQKKKVIYQCTKCEGIFEINTVKDSRNYIPYFYYCIFCGSTIDRRNFEILQ